MDNGNSNNFDLETSAIMGLFDTYLRWKNKGGNRSYAYFHPSEFGKCLRKHMYKYYVYNGDINVEKEDLDSDKIRLFDKGHNMHERWTRYAEKAGFLRGYWLCDNINCSSNNHPDDAVFHGDRRIYGKDNLLGCFKPERCDCGSESFSYEEVDIVDKRLNFYGHCDMIFDFSNITDDKFDGVRRSFSSEYLPKKPVVCDMKTCNERKFNILEKDGKPDPEYVIQLNIYAKILGLDYGILIYECKNNSKIKTFKVDQSDKVFSLIERQCLTLQTLMKEKKLPPPKPKSTSEFECRYCEFKDICKASAIWKDENLSAARKQFYEMD